MVIGSCANHFLTTSASKVCRSRPHERRRTNLSEENPHFVTFTILCEVNYFRLVLCRTRASLCAHHQSVFTLRNAHSWEKTFASDIVRTIWGQAVLFLGVTENGSTCSRDKPRHTCHPNTSEWQPYLYMSKCVFFSSRCVTVWFYATNVYKQVIFKCI